MVLSKEQKITMLVNVLEQMGKGAIFKDIKTKEPIKTQIEKGTHENTFISTMSSSGYQDLFKKEKPQTSAYTFYSLQDNYKESKTYKTYYKENI